MVIITFLIQAYIFVILLGATKLVLFGYTLHSLSCVPIVHMVKKMLKQNNLTFLLTHSFVLHLYTFCDLQ